jgi:hypothetical protein
MAVCQLPDVLAETLLSGASPLPHLNGFQIEDGEGT